MAAADTGYSIAAAVMSEQGLGEGSLGEKEEQRQHGRGRR
jgi:hypothetical protein